MKRRLCILAVAAVALFGAACGTANDATEGSVATPAVSAAAHVSPPAASAPVTAATPQLPVTVQDHAGRSVTVTDVSRVIPINGEIAEIIFALGLGDRVVAVDTSATFPPVVESLPTVGNQRGLNAEGILSFKPSLIIGNENAGPPAVIEQLRSAGVPVVIITYEPTLESVPTKIRAVATALGVAERGDAIAHTTQAEIEAARALAAKATTKPKVAFLNVRGGGTQQMWGEGTSGAAMITAAGGIDGGSSAGIKGSKPITAEALVAMQPDAVLVLSASLKSIGGIDGLLAIPGVAQTSAGKNRRVLEYEDQYLLGLGPRAGQALLDLVKTLHPELR